MWGFAPLGEVVPLIDIALDRPVELAVPAKRSMMLVLRLTAAGVVARAGLTVDRMDDVKLAVEEACSCLIGESGGPEALRLRFAQDGDCLRVTVRGEGGEPVSLSEDEREVVRCILESLADGAQIRMDGEAVSEIELRVALGA